MLVPRRIRGGDQGRLELPTETHVADVGPGVAQAPDGSLWVAVHPTLDFKLGWEAVDSLNKGVKLDDIHCAVPGPRGWTIFKLVGAVQAPAVVDDLKSALKRSLDLGKVEPSAESKIADPKEEVGGDGPEETDDARTLPVEYDEQGERYKPWRDVCKEVREYSYPDWVHEGPQSCLHLIKHMQKNGGSPKLWLQVWSRFKGIQDNDRVMHEMRVLMECLEHGGSYDQLNLASLACMETISRRVQSIVDAYNSGSSSAPDWGAARILSGYQGPEDVVTPGLRSWAAKKGKEEVELAAARAKIREHKKLSIPTDEAAKAIADGNPPQGGGEGKPKRKAKVKPLAPPADS